MTGYGLETSPNGVHQATAFCACMLKESGNQCMQFSAHVCCLGKFEVAKGAGTVRTWQLPNTSCMRHTYLRKSTRTLLYGTHLHASINRMSSPICKGVVHPILFVTSQVTVVSK